MKSCIIGLVAAWCWLAVLSQNEEEEEGGENPEDLAEYTLTFRTSGLPGSGTDANVMLKMTGDTKTTGYPIRYRGTGKVFSVGSVDVFNVTDITYIGPICSVEVWNSASTTENIWTLESLTILDQKTDDKAVFNISRKIGQLKSTFLRTGKADGKWSKWSDWSICNGTCPTGSHNRYRSCSRPPPSCGGVECEGEANQTESCPMPDCMKQEVTTAKTDNSSSETTTVSIIVPIAIALFIIIVVIAVIVFRRKKRREEEISSKKVKEQNHEHVVAYDKMQRQGDNSYVT